MKELATLIQQFATEEGLSPSVIPGVHLARMTRPRPRNRTRWGASLSLLVRGGKEIYFGDEKHRFPEGHLIAAPIDISVESRVPVASVEHPFLAIKIDFDPVTLREMARHIPRAASEDLGKAIFGAALSEPMLDAAVRLVRLLAQPGDAAALGPLVVKEMFYHLVKSPCGPAIRQYVLGGGHTHRIAQAVHAIKTDLRAELNADALAKSAGLGRSIFFERFKDVMTMSPIQYQKHLRLLEARRLMMEEGETAEGAAFRVGYNSASQFSREYSRMFGRPPSRDRRRP